MFPPARPKGLGYWGHIPQTPCQSRLVGIWIPRTVF